MRSRVDTCTHQTQNIAEVGRGQTMGSKCQGRGDPRGSNSSEVQTTGSRADTHTGHPIQNTSEVESGLRGGIPRGPNLKGGGGGPSCEG